MIKLFTGTSYGLCQLPERKKRDKNLLWRIKLKLTEVDQLLMYPFCFHQMILILNNQVNPNYDLTSRYISMILYRYSKIFIPHYETI